MLGQVDWRFIAVAVCCVILGIERLWRSRRKSLTLTGKAMLTALFSLAGVCAAYGTMALTGPFYNIGLALWHAGIGVLIGSLELLVLTLRVEQVARSAVRRIMLRVGLVTAVLILTWPPGFAFVEPVTRLSGIRPWSLALIVHVAVFHAYILWGLIQVIVLAVRRVPRDIKRRPTSAVALLMVGAGASGFAWINLVIVFHLLTTGNDAEIGGALAPNVLFLALFVVGSALLAVGERIADEFMARYRLARLRRLWSRAVELSPYDLQLATELPAPARLQRAYVEISDALCTLRVKTDAQLTVEQAADLLRRGAITNDPTAPTISQALPTRATRQEDLALIHALAKTYG